MVKFLSIVGLCLLSASLGHAGLRKDQAMEKFLPAAHECCMEVGATPKDIEDMVMKRPAAGRAAKCLRACIMQRFDVMDAAGNIVPSVALEHARTFSGGNPMVMKMATEILDVCCAIPVAADRCESAEQYSKCFHEQSVAHGLDKMDF